ncbi:MAG: hypothetical protein ACI9A1_000304 [Lentimonas sp.]
MPMPKKLKRALKRQMARVTKQLERDLESPDFAGAFMPESLGKRRAQREAKELTLVPAAISVSQLCGME